MTDGVDEPIRVLHVDDGVFRGLVADSLERRGDGIVVETAPDTPTALRRLETEASVGCLLGDYATPGADGRVKYANRAYLELHGRDREELLGEP